MRHCVLLVLAALTAVHAKEKVTALTGNAICEWTNFKYNESVINTIQYSFKRSDGSEVGGKEVFFMRVNSTNGNVAVVMTFKPIRSKDVQLYKCQLWTTEWDKSELRTVQVSAPPVPVVNISSVTIFEGEALTINCSFKSSTPYSLGSYTFRRYDKDVAGEIPKNLKIQVAQESITIAAATQEHRGFYVCTATNEVNSTSIQIQLRVKSPLAAIWPAIGIFLEVVVLIIIVLVYERRREAAKEQNAGDADNSQNNSREKSKNSSDVRQRGVKG